MKKILLKVALLTALFSVCFTGCSMGGGDAGAGGNGGNGGTKVDDHTAVDKPIKGTLTTPETWPGYDSEGNVLTYYINSRYDIKKGGALVIESGAIVKFGPSGGITVYQEGSLEAEGVVFTSYRDSRGRKILAAGETAPAAGDWKNIKISGGSSIFTGCEFSYGGNGVSTLYVVKNTTIGKARVKDCTFKHNSGTMSASYSVCAALRYDDSVTYDKDKDINCITGTTFEDNIWPLSIPAFFSLDDSNHFADNNRYNYVHINSSTIKQNVTWDKQDVPYIYLNSTYMLAVDGGILTINGGADENNPNTLCFSVKGIDINKGGEMDLNGYVTFTNSPESPNTYYNGLLCSKNYKFDTTGNGKMDHSVSTVLLLSSSDNKFKVLNFENTGSNHVHTYQYYMYHEEEIKDKNFYETNF